MASNGNDVNTCADNGKAEATVDTVVVVPSTSEKQKRIEVETGSAEKPHPSSSALEELERTAVPLATSNGASLEVVTDDDAGPLCSQSGVAAGSAQSETEAEHIDSLRFGASIKETVEIMESNLEDKAERLDSVLINKEMKKEGSEADESNEAKSLTKDESVTKCTSDTVVHPKEVLSFEKDGSSSKHQKDEHLKKELESVSNNSRVEEQRIAEDDKAVITRVGDGGLEGVNFSKSDGLSSLLKDNIVNMEESCSAADVVTAESVLSKEASETKQHNEDRIKVGKVAVGDSGSEKQPVATKAVVVDGEREEEEVKVVGSNREAISQQQLNSEVSLDKDKRLRVTKDDSVSSATDGKGIGVASKANESDTAATSINNILNDATKFTQEIREAQNDSKHSEEFRIVTGSATAERKEFQIGIGSVNAESRELHINTGTATNESIQPKIDTETATAESREFQIDTESQESQIDTDSSTLRSREPQIDPEIKKPQIDADSATPRSKEPQVDTETATAESKEHRIDTESDKLQTDADSATLKSKEPQINTDESKEREISNETASIEAKEPEIGTLSVTTEDEETFSSNRLASSNVSKSESCETGEEKEELDQNDSAKDGDHDSGVDESTQGKPDGSPEKQIKPRSPVSVEKTVVADVKKKSSSVTSSPARKSAESPARSTKIPSSSSSKASSQASGGEKKLPMNKIVVGVSASPNLKVVKSKIGSMDNVKHRAGGGEVKLEKVRIDLSSVKSKVGSTDNIQHKATGGDKKVITQKLEWKAQSKIGSLDNASYKAGGGNKKIETQKLDFKEKAKPKVGSKEKVDHKPGGGAVQIEEHKLKFKESAKSKVGSLDNVKHKPGGGAVQIYDEKLYYKQSQHASSSKKSSLTGSDGHISDTQSHSPQPSPSNGVSPTPGLLIETDRSSKSNGVLIGGAAEKAILQDGSVIAATLPPSQSVAAAPQVLEAITVSEVARNTPEQET